MGRKSIKKKSPRRKSPRRKSIKKSRSLKVKFTPTEVGLFLNPDFVVAKKRSRKKRKRSRKNKNRFGSNRFGKDEICSQILLSDADKKRLNERNNYFLNEKKYPLKKTCVDEYEKGRRFFTNKLELYLKIKEILNKYNNDNAYKISKQITKEEEETLRTLGNDKRNIIKIIDRFKKYVDLYIKESEFSCAEYNYLLDMFCSDQNMQSPA